MALYLIGDVQGCDTPLGRLLQKIDFSPSRDTLYLLGDLVNRGPDSDRVLRRLMGYGDAARCLLGNHDLSLLAVAHGIRMPHPRDTMRTVLQAPDCSALLEWLRHRPMAMQAQGVLMVHAGVLPQWDVAQVMAQVQVHGYTQATHLLAQGDLLADLKQWTGPLTIASGRADTITPMANCQALAQACHVAWHDLGDVGHACALEGADAVNALLGLVTPTVTP